MRIQYILVAVLVLSLLAPHANAQATSDSGLPAAGLKPGSPFYVLDGLLERVELAVARDKTAKRMMIAREKLAEAYELANEGGEDPHIARALGRHDDLLYEVEVEMAEATGSPEIYAKAVYMNASLNRHQQAITRLQSVLASKCKDRPCGKGITMALENLQGKIRLSGERAEKRRARADLMAAKHGASIPAMMREEFTRQADEKVDAQEKKEETSQQTASGKKETARGR